MKKIIALALAILMMAAIAVPAMAENNTMNQVEGSQSADTVVSFGTQDGYIVTVPAAVTINTETATEVSVVATQVIIPGNKVLKVSVESAHEVEGKWYMAPSDGIANDNVLYEVALTSGGDAITNNTVVLEVASNQKDGEGALTLGKTATLYLTTDGTTQSGRFEDTLTFTTALDDAPQQGS